MSGSGIRIRILFCLRVRRIAFQTKGGNGRTKLGVQGGLRMVLEIAAKMVISLWPYFDSSCVRRTKMEKKKILFVLLGSICLGILLLTLPCMAAPAPKPEPIVIKAVHYMVKTHGRAVLFTKLLDLIKERSKGEIIIQFLGGPEVIPSSELAQGVRLGSVQMGALPSAFYEGLVPGVSLLGLSQISSEEERKRGAWNLIREMHEKANLHFLGRDDPKNEPMWYVTTSRKRVTKISDLSGLKMGAPTPIPKAVAEAFGMAFVLVPYPDAYSALDGRIVDAFCVPPDGQVQFGLHEPVKYGIDHPFYVSNSAIIINLDTWKRIPPSLQKVVTDAYMEWEPEPIRVIRAEVAKYKQVMIDGGIEFIKFSPDEAKLFLDTAYKVEWERQSKLKPEIAPKLMKLLSK